MVFFFLLSVYSLFYSTQADPYNNIMGFGHGPIRKPLMKQTNVQIQTLFFDFKDALAGFRESFIPKAPRICKFGTHCKSGDSCPFTHPRGVNQQEQQPSTTIRLCRFGSQCKWKEKCAFLHPEDQLYKTAPCREYLQSKTCSYGERCKFFHHPSEARIRAY